MGSKILVVLDHLNGVVRLHDYDENIWDDPSEVIDENGYVLNGSCDYMVVSEFKLQYAKQQ